MLFAHNCEVADGVAVAVKYASENIAGSAYRQPTSVGSIEVGGIAVIAIEGISPVRFAPRSGVVIRTIEVEIRHQLVAAKIRALVELHADGQVWKSGAPLLSPPSSALVL